MILSRGLVLDLARWGVMGPPREHPVEDILQLAQSSNTLLQFPGTLSVACGATEPKQIDVCWGSSWLLFTGVASLLHCATCRMASAILVHQLKLQLGRSGFKTN
jgi:hypothetical protein